MEQFLPGLTVKYVGGHIPELHIFPDEEGDDTVIEKIDLTKHFGKPKPTADDMRSLLLEKGFTKHVRPADDQSATGKEL